MNNFVFLNAKAAPQQGTFHLGTGKDNKGI
jgi:hypothetical protein